MLPAKPTESRAAELEQAIERQILQRTWGRIHRLQVEVIGERVIIHGCTQSYHSKQLALEAVLDVIGAAGPAQVDLEIHVAGNSPAAVSRRAAGFLG